MNADEQMSALQMISKLAHEIAMSDDVMSPHDRVDLWLVAHGVVDELRTTERALHHDASVALHELGKAYDELYHSRLGRQVVMRKRRRVTNEQWHGYDLINAIARDVISTTTGEHHRAVPIDVLRRVVPACATQSSTSSKWNKTGLRGLVNVEHYHSADVRYDDALDVLDLDDSTIIMLAGEQVVELPDN